MASEYRDLLLSLGPTVWVDGVSGTHLQETGNSPRLKHSNGLDYALSSGTGPIVGGADCGVAGEKAFCCLLGGLKTLGEIPNLNNLITTGFSIVAIIKPRAWGSSWDRIVSFGTAFINSEIIFSRYNGQSNLHLGWWNGTSSGPFIFSTNNGLILGKEQMVAATWNPADGKARLYMDGVKVAESAIAGPATDANRKTFAMGQNCGTTELFDGYITLPAVFLRPLTDAEIAALADKSTVKSQHLSGNLKLAESVSGGQKLVVGRTKRTGDIAFKATPDASGNWSADIANVAVDLQYTGLAGYGAGYLAGTFPDGITSVLGAPSPASIRVMLRPTAGQLGDGALVATTTSAADGSWRVDNLDPSLKFDVVCRKTGYNDMIWANVSPTPY